MEFTNDKANGCEAMCVSIYGIEQNAVQLRLMNIDKKRKIYLDRVNPGSLREQMICFLQSGYRLLK